MTAQAPLTNQRDLFQIPDEICYLNCAYISPLLKSTAEAGKRGMERKLRPWEISPPDFFSTAQQIRATAGSLLGSTANEVAIVPSASYGLAAAARNLPVHKGQNILVLAEQYPSNYYVWESMARKTGAILRSVPRPADGDWTRGILEMLDNDTAIAALPHCHWSDGTLVDLARVRHRLDQTGGALVVDLTQSLGAMVFDLDAIRPDFAVAAAYKWLLGPYATGLLYVDPRHHDGDPLELPIFSRKNAVQFSDISYRNEFEPGACRFDVGEVANFALLPALHDALLQILEWQVPRIQASLAERTAIIATEASALGLEVVDPMRRAPHFLGIRFPNGLPVGLAEHFHEQQVYVSVRGDALRVTPHLYNTEDDQKRFIHVLRSFM
ncbi:MAG TPA: aminotransferase [Gammaproteobacteria bacterium]|nr:aminotransferase [Gammaproteobacteria bacterium]